MTTYAGRYNELVISGGAPLTGTVLHLVATGTGIPPSAGGSGTVVPTYTDTTAGTVASSSGAVTTDSRGNCAFYALPIAVSGGIDIYQGTQLLITDARPIPDVRSFGASKSGTLTVSPVGTGAGLLPNNGCDFGPDTVGTTTSGIQEAINSLPTTATLLDANNNVVTGARKGVIAFSEGIYSCTTNLLLPVGQYKFIGTGIGPDVIGTSAATTVTGGTTIYLQGISSTNPLGFSLATSTQGYACSSLWMDGVEFRAASPASSAGSTSSIVNLDALWRGIIENVAATEVNSSGGAGHNICFGMSIATNAFTSEKTFRHIITNGAYFGFSTNASHLDCQDIVANYTGGTAGGGAGYDAGFNIAGNVRQSFNQMIAYTCSNALALSSYPYGQPFAPVTLRNFMMEACTHYGYGTAGAFEQVIFEKPIWSTLNPTTDLAARVAPTINSSGQQSGGIFITSVDEVDGNTLGVGRHLAVPGLTGNTGLTMGSSPFTVGPFTFNAKVAVTANAGNISALTFNGVTAAVPSANQLIDVPKGCRIAATYSSTAPTYSIIPT